MTTGSLDSTGPVAATEAGTQIGPYRVISTLGVGGMGKVYLAASRSGRAVAVKVVRAELANDPEFRHRFATEVAAARAVSGAFTTPVVDADPDGPLPWLATAYVAGPSLREAIENYGPMPEASVRVLAAGLAEALVAIHQAGLIHRDLKPSNILLAADGPRVIDFGISKAVDATAFTGAGEIIGSAGYMSPEHAAGQPLTPASDVFSLGAVVAFAATGRPPFGVGPVHALLFRTLHEPPRLDGVPPALLGLVAACLDKDPARRPPAGQLPGWLHSSPAAAGWLGAVADELAHREQTVSRAVRKPVLKRRAMLIGGGVLVAAAVAGTAAAFWPTRPTPTLRWRTTLPGTDLYADTVGADTVICVNQTAAATFDRATGRPLWNGTAESATAVMSDGAHVYAVRTDGQLHAIDARTGHQLWASSASGSNAPNLELVTASTVLTVDDNGTYYGVNTADGSTRWSGAAADGHGQSAQDPTSSGQVLLVSDGGQQSADNMLSGYTVVSLDKGTRQWSTDVVALHAPPTGDTWYAIDRDMNLLGLAAATGQRRWSRSTTLPPTVAEMLFYTQSLNLTHGVLICQPMISGKGTNNVLAAFDPADGRTLWNRQTSSTTTGYAVLGQTLCYYDTALRAIDLRTGNPLWTHNNQPTGTALLGATNTLFLTTDTKSLYGWDATTGEQIWHFAVSGPASAIQTPGTLLVTDNTSLYNFQIPSSA